jgi:hypothetical protein
MLYINAYRVSRVYGGHEEGGWYYDAGEPLAAIPIETKEERGKDYYFTSDGKFHVRECMTCGGAGEYEEEDPTYEPAAIYMKQCEYCGELPASEEEVLKTFKSLEKLLKPEIDRNEDFRIALEGHMAAHYPERRPHYE